jgi:Arc/MetJ-type ribon-helix-helix transcriptional regulator
LRESSGCSNLNGIENPVAGAFAVAFNGFPRQPALTPVGCIVILRGMVRKIAVTLDHKTVTELDRWVREGRYPNRSRALQSAVDLLTEREKRSRLARELKKLDRIEEQGLAEEGVGDSSWPRF